MSFTTFPLNGHTAACFVRTLSRIPGNRASSADQNTGARGDSAGAEYSALSEDAPEQRIDINIGVYLASLDDSERADSLDEAAV